jgi:predicted membrane GTPase involved in stress response
MSVNVTKAKKQSNVCSSEMMKSENYSSNFSLEEALEYIQRDKMRGKQQPILSLRKKH